MITRTDQFVQAIEQMGRMHSMLESYQKDILPKNPRTFVVFCTGPLEMIRQLRAQIDEYLSHIGPTLTPPAAYESGAAQSTTVNGRREEFAQAETASVAPSAVGHAERWAQETIISNIDQFVQAIEQMARMQQVLESYQKDILPKNPRTFVVFCEGPLEQIRQLQAQIDEFLAARSTEPELESAAVLHDKPAK